MKLHIQRFWKRFVVWFSEPDLDLHRFEKLESKKVIKKGVSQYGEY